MKDGGTGAPPGTLRVEGWNNGRPCWSNNCWLVVSNMAFMTSISYMEYIILPIDELIVFKMVIAPTRLGVVAIFHRYEKMIKHMYNVRTHFYAVSSGKLT